MPAEDKYLLMTLSEIKIKTVNHYAAWWTIVGIDPIAFRLVWIFQKWIPKINPNAVTVFSLLTGLLAALIFATGQYFWGGLLYEVAFLLDCIDGKVARMRGVSSQFGRFFDGFVNNVVYCAALIGLAVSDLSNSWLVFGCMLGLLFHVLGLEVSYILKNHGGAHDWNYEGRDLSIRGRLRRSVPGMWPDRHLSILWVLPSLGYATFGILTNAIIDFMLLIYRVRLIFIILVREDAKERK